MSYGGGNFGRGLPAHFFAGERWSASLRCAAVASASVYEGRNNPWSNWRLAACAQGRAVAAAPGGGGAGGGMARWCWAPAAHASARR